MAAATAVSDARVTIRGVMRRCLRASANPPMVGTSSRAVAALPTRSLRAMADDANIPEHDPIEQRVLGSLLEKQKTVPDTYPMTLNRLRTACNQTSGRATILHLSDSAVKGRSEERRVGQEGGKQCRIRW